MHPNATTMGRLLGVACFHVGQRVRVTQRISRGRQIVQDAEGTVTEIVPGDNEPPLPVDAADHGIVLLRVMPRAVLVRLDDHDGSNGGEPHVFYENGKPGVFQFIPHTQPGDKAIDVGATKKVRFERTQIPLQPLEPHTIHGAQGKSAHLLRASGRADTAFPGRRPQDFLGGERPAEQRALARGTKNRYFRSAGAGIERGILGAGSPGPGGRKIVT
jgi:hypothetical protein